MLKIGLYFRKSTDDGKRQKASIEDQKAWAYEYLKSLKEPYEIIVEYEEKQSAKAPGRPLFNELMRKIYNKEVDTLVVWAVDRLSRNEIDEGAIKWAVREGFLKQIHTKDTIYTENELFTMGIFLSMSAEEIATMRKRILRRMNNMVEKEGKVPFHAPYGYRNIGEGKVEVNEAEARVVKRIFQMRIDGMSYQIIANVLNDEGVSTRRKNGAKSSGKWSKSIVEYVLKNEFYIGVVKFMDTVGEGIFERFISRDIFEEANKETRMNIGHKHKSFLLKGILLGPNRKPLTASLIKGKYVYYHSSDWKFRISETEIFKKCEKIVENWVFPDDVMRQVEDYIQNNLFAEFRAILEEKKELEKQLKDMEKQDFNLAKIFMMGKIDEKMFDAQKRELSNERMKIVEKLESFTAIGMADLEKYQKIIELVKNLIVVYKNGDNVQKGLILRNAIIELQVDEEKSLKIKEKEPFYWLSLLNVQYGRGSWTGTSDQSVMSRLL